MYSQNKTMKTLKIYNIIASILLLLLAIWIIQLRKDLEETEAVLEQCSHRYYQEINKEKPKSPGEYNFL